MEKIIDNLENYNIINFLIPGVIFVNILSFLIEKELHNDNIGIALVEYYFSGLVLSRIGSIIIKPALSKIKVVKFDNYEKYIKKEDKDEKLKLLQKEANQYRTYISVFTVLSFVEIYNCVFINYLKWKYIILFVAISVLFVMSYKKQINFIIERLNIKVKK